MKQAEMQLQEHIAAHGTRDVETITRLRRASLAPSPAAFISPGAGMTNEDMMAAASAEYDATPKEDADLEMESLLDSINISEFLSDSDDDEGEDEELEQYSESEEEDQASSEEGDEFKERPEPSTEGEEDNDEEENDLEEDEEDEEQVLSAGLPAVGAVDASWASRNLEAGGAGAGCWTDTRWADAHIERSLPLAGPLLDQLILALPLADGMQVAVLGGGGRAPDRLLRAYPDAVVSLIGADGGALQAAAADLARTGRACAVQPALRPSDEIPGAEDVEGYDIVASYLALPRLAGGPGGYGPLFARIFASLAPGGTFVAADLAGAVALFAHLRLLEDAGFERVDCQWRERDCFVCAGRKPE
jgi:hypothetical protein